MKKAFLIFVLIGSCLALFAQAGKPKIYSGVQTTYNNLTRYGSGLPTFNPSGFQFDTLSWDYVDTLTGQQFLWKRTLWSVTNEVRQNDPPLPTNTVPNPDVTYKDAIWIDANDSNNEYFFDESLNAWTPLGHYIGASAPSDIAATGTTGAVVYKKGLWFDTVAGRLKVWNGTAWVLFDSSDNWGTQVVQRTARLAGDGTGGNPLDLASSGVTPGTYSLATVTVDAYGRVTVASNGTVNLATQVSGTLAPGNGGTGLSALGTDFQLLRTNAGATAMEWWTPNYLTVEVDGSTTNELQNLSYNALTRALGISSGTGITLPIFGATDAGLVPSSGGGTTLFLRADGTWASPGGGLSGGTLGQVTVWSGTSSVTGFASFTATSNAVLFPDGSASSPGIGFVNQSGLGLNRPTANVIGFSSSGAEIMRMDANGLAVKTTSTNTSSLRVGVTGTYTLASAISVPQTGVYVLAGTITDNSGSGGTLTNVSNNVFGAPTYAFSTATTMLNAVNLYVASPTAGTNATITSNFAIYAAGNGRFTGALGLDGASINEYSALSIGGNKQRNITTSANTGMGGITLNSQILTDVANSGTIPLVYTNVFNNTAYAFSNPVTISNAVSLRIVAPTAGTNATITNAYALSLSGNAIINQGGLMIRRNTASLATPIAGLHIFPFDWVGAVGVAGGGNIYVQSATMNDAITAAGTTLSSVSPCVFSAPTLSASNTNVTYTDAATLYVAASPTASTNVTITNPYAFWVDAGNVRLDGYTGGNGITPTAPFHARHSSYTANSVSFKVTSQRVAIGSAFEIGSLDFDSDDNQLAAGGQTVARVFAVSEGTHTTTSLATALVFATTPSGSITLTERMRIDAGGAMLWAGNAGTAGQVLQSNGANAVPTWVTPSGGLSGSGVANQVAVWNGTSALTGFTPFTYLSGALSLGVSGTQGSLKLLGTTSGTVTITTLAAAGTWTLTLPNNGGSVGQVLASTGSGTTQWATLDFVQQNGNSYSAAMTIGTNDAFSLSLETNNTIWWTMNTSGFVSQKASSSLLSQTAHQWTFDKTTTAVDDDEMVLSYYLDDAVNTSTNFASIAVIASNVANGSEAGSLAFRTMSAGVLATRFSVLPTGASVTGALTVSGASTVSGLFTANGGFNTTQVSKTSAYTMTKNDFHVEVNSTSGAFTITLDGTPNTGQMYLFSRANAGANNVTVNPNGKNINGVSGNNTTLLDTQFESHLLKYTGSEWRIIF